MLSVIAIVRSESTGAPSQVIARGVVTGFGLRGEILEYLKQVLGLEQLVAMSAALKQLRRVFSRHIDTDFVVLGVNTDELARVHVASAAQMAALERDQVSIALIVPADFEGSHKAGRPDDGPIELAFKNALAQATSRILRLGLLAGDGDTALYERVYAELGNRLQAHESLFNLNQSHHIHNAFPVRHWCEENGPDILAAAYGVEREEGETLLTAAFAHRLRKQSFSAVLESEIRLVETLTTWLGALRSRSAGEVTRRDTVRRLLAETGHSWQTAPGELTPPRFSRGSAQKIVAEKAMETLSVREMIDAALLFDLEPAFDLFPTRRFALPLLAMAAFAGRLGWRRQHAAIKSPVLAMGLIALVEERGFANADITGPAGEGDIDDELGMDLAHIEKLLWAGGLSPHELRQPSVDVLTDGMARPVMLPAGRPRFFVDDD